MWDAFEDFVTHLELDKSASDGTLTKRRRALKDFTEFAEGRGLEDPNDVDRRTIARYVDDLVERGYAYNTIMSSRYSSVGAALRYLYRERRIDESVMERVDRSAMKSKARESMSEAEKKAEGGPPPHLSKEEVYELAENVGTPTDRNEILVKLQFWTGCRASEIAGITPDDIDMSEPSIEVFSPKTDTTRTVSYPRAEINPLLRDWLHNGRLRYKCADSTDKVFVGYKGPIAAKQVNYVVRKAAKEAGLADAARETKDGRQYIEQTSHILRHSHAMHYLNEKDVDIKKISDHLGHSSVDVTENFYAETTNEELVNTFGE